MRWLPYYIIYRIARGRRYPRNTPPPAGTGATLFAGFFFFVLFGLFAALFIGEGPLFLAVPFVFLTFMSILWTVASLPLHHR